MKRIGVLIMILAAVTLLTAQARLKDISQISGMDERELIGYGLVVGLQGTGDSPASQATIQSITNMLEHFGLTVPENRVRPNNVAAVMVTAVMPPFASPGSRFDIRVSSMADARSLEGGELLMTPLTGNDNRLYAIAQGSISIGGFVEEARGSRVRRNVVNAGRIPNGATVQLENVGNILRDGTMQIMLNTPDFTTAERTVEAINNSFDARIATARNASNITVTVPDEFIMNDNLISFIASIENLEIMPQVNARVIINERTGTIVAGGTVRINSVAIAHGNLMIRVSHDVGHLTAGPFNLATYIAHVEAQEDHRMFVMESATVQELAQALNAIKVTPRDMISIFQALKEAGALMAELRII
jgi:flagellar P-ring protein precursor FlgI